jgi:predicted RNase H-like nuclease
MILEVQPVAQQDSRVYEVHPEVSFVQANSGMALRWAKASWNGVTLRRRILADHGIVLPDDLGETGAAGIADLLDAAIAAWSAARIAGGKAEAMPDRTSRVGAIWR